LQAVVDTVGDTSMMEVDEHAEDREVQDRVREERRGRDDRGPRYPAGPSNYDRRREEPYDDRRYGGDERRWGGGGARGGGGGGRYRDGGRTFQRGGGQSYRP